MTYVWTLGELMVAQPLRLGLGALVRTVRWCWPAAARPQVPPMSRGWLQQHSVDAGKHDGMR
jgi:hypothetical protein